MNEVIDHVAMWLVDFHFLSTVLLLLVLAATGFLRQPVRRLVVAKSAVLSVLLLGLLSALPGWSPVHLLPRDKRATDIASVRQSPTLVETRPASSVAPNVRMPELVLNAHRDATPAAEPSIVRRWFPFTVKESIVLAYFVGSGCVLTWLGLGAVAASRLVQTSLPAPDRLRWVLAELTVGDERVPDLRISDRVDVAAAIGVFRPTVLLPNTWLIDRRDEEMHSILAHERAHLRNGDLRWMTIGRTLLVLTWAQPLYWLLRRRMRLDQEALADAAAAELSSRQRYAEQLVALARNVPVRPRLAIHAAVGLWERPSQLRRRIALLLDEQLLILRNCSVGWRWTAGATMVAAACVLSLVTMGPEGQVSAEPDAASEAANANESLEYSGKVFDKRTGEPIVGAKVVVRRKTSSVNPWRTLAESEHTTAADGSYRFGIPPEQLADSKLYIELDVTHADYAPRTGFGYALSMIRKNEKLGAIPFFERVELEPADRITGIVVTPDGRPANAVPVLAFSKARPNDLAEYGSFTRGATDNKGRFQLNVAKGGHSVLWLLPDDYAQQTHVLNDRVGDLGAFPLEDGVRLSGQVVDHEGSPIADIWVNAELVDGPAKKEIRMPVTDYIKRSALTDAEGKFLLAPLPPGTYRVLPENRPDENPRRDREPRPLSAVFLPQRVTIASEQPAEPMLVQAAETVTIEAQVYDSAGKPRSGHAVHFFGRTGDDSREHYFADAVPDASGRIVLQVPKGLRSGELDLSCNEHQVLRHRSSSNGRLIANRTLEIDTLDHDCRGIEIYYYTAPILIVSAIDSGGKPIADFKPALFYRNGVKPREEGSRWLSGVDGEVNFEHQEDGRWRSEQLLPDEEFILTVLAEGFQTAARSMSLAEGEVKELDFPLAKNVAGVSRNGSANTVTQHSVSESATATLFVAGEPSRPWAYKPNVLALDVRDEEGEPVAGVEATVYRVDRTDGTREKVGRGTSDQDGAVEFTHLIAKARAATYQEMAAKSQYPTSPGDIFYVVLQRQGSATIVLPASDYQIAAFGHRHRVRMRPAAELVGRVTDRSGNAVAGATVAAGALAGTFAVDGINALTTDNEGRFRFVDLVAFDRTEASKREAAPDNWQLADAAQPDAAAIYDPIDETSVSDLVVTHPDYAVTTVRGGDVPGTTDVVMAPAAAIDGRVVDFASKQPVAGIRVFAAGAPLPPGLPSTRENSDRFDVLSQIHTASTLTDERGQYHLANLPAGNYSVWAEPSADGSESEPVCRGHRDIKATAGAQPIEAPDLVMGPGGTIRGQLIDEATGKPLTFENGSPKVRAVFAPVDGANYQPTRVQDVQATSGGSFMVRGIPGKARLLVIVYPTGVGADPEGEYRSVNESLSSGRIYDLKHDKTIDAEVPVRPRAQIDAALKKTLKVFELMNAGKDEEAIEHATRLIAANPELNNVWMGRAAARARLGQTRELVAEYEQWLATGPSSPYDWMIRNNYAHLLATTPDDSYRDGTRAVQLAEEAIQLAGDVQPYQRSELYDTLASAHAEVGEFAQAVEAQRKSIAFAPVQNRDNLRDHLELYESGKPLRESR